VDLAEVPLAGALLKGIQRMNGLKANASTYEGRFLLACLSKGFSPKVLLLAPSRVVLAAQLRSLKFIDDCIGCCLTAAEAIEILRLEQPGFISITGFASSSLYQDVIDYVSKNCLQTRILVIIEDLGPASVPRSADAIVAAVDLANPDNPILQALMALVSGTTYRSPSVEAFVAQSDQHIDILPQGRVFLSLRDRQLLSGYLLGLSNKEMAVRLNLSPRTVQTYSGILLQKLGVNNRQKALRAAIKMGYSRFEKLLSS
jgi:DNA-binding NarL/FixJ family response regulator